MVDENFFCKLKGLVVKTIFVAANFICGALALFFGLVALLDSNYHPVASVLLGALSFGLGATCVWIAKASWSHLKIQSEASIDATPSLLLP